MRTFRSFAFVPFVLFLAGAAHASQTIDLIWAETGEDLVGAVSPSSTVTLQVILTVSTDGSQGASVSVDYSRVLNTLEIVGYSSTPSEGDDSPLPLPIGETIDTGTRIEGINAGALPPYIGTGLTAPGQSFQLGTVTFHQILPLVGTIEITADANGPTDVILDLAAGNVSGTTDWNSAFIGSDPPDFDRDEVEDARDNCAGRANPDQDDTDEDGLGNVCDNCSEIPNPAQDDTDGDDCGNLCDADYDNSGTVGFPDFGFFRQCFSTTNELCQHVEPIGDRLNGFPDFGFFTANFSSVPGPSGTTAGTTACP